MRKSRILIVDDDSEMRAVLQDGLESRGFEVVPAATVNEALRLISTESFDVLLSDLRLPDAGDGFTLVSAIRHTQPHALTLLLTGHPALQDAVTAILHQADHVLVKPVGVAAITEIIQKKLAKPSARETKTLDRVATILERDAGPTISVWMSRAEPHAQVAAISMTCQDRTGHVPQLLADLVKRLRLAPHLQVPISAAARSHGILRRKQGYTIALLVEEFRNLQLSIFDTLRKNRDSLDFSTVLPDVMTLADEIDSQLDQAVLGFTESSPGKRLNLTAQSSAA